MFDGFGDMIDRVELDKAVVVGRRRLVGLAMPRAFSRKARFAFVGWSAPGAAATRFSNFLYFSSRSRCQ